MREKNDKFYTSIDVRITKMIEFLESEINSVPPHSHAWYSYYELHSRLIVADQSIKTIINEVLGNPESYKYDKELDVRERITKKYKKK